MLRTLLIDNYDSYTFNLFHLLATVNGCEPIVITNDSYSWEFVRREIIPYVHAIVLSPGPGTPENKSDFGLCLDILKEENFVRPVLGVCLGHQGIASAFGCAIIQATTVAHGIISEVYHSSIEDPESLLFEIPSPFSVVRYHSLIVEEGLSKSIKSIAFTSDNICMALKHAHLPLYGVQFHPESICSSYGSKLLQNFRRIASHYVHNEHIMVSQAPCRSLADPNKFLRLPMAMDNVMVNLSSLETLVIEKISIPSFNNEQLDVSIFESLFKRERAPCFWLDSSRQDIERSRYSYMGTMQGRNSFFLEYMISNRTITLKKENEAIQTCHLEEYSFFDVMNRCSRAFCVESYETLDGKSTDKPNIPFLGGFVGYFGYKMHLESLPHRQREMTEASLLAQNMPDAAFMFADCVVAFDFEKNEISIMSLTSENSSEKAICLQTILSIKNAILKVMDQLGEDDQKGSETFRDPRFSSDKPSAAMLNCSLSFNELSQRSKWFNMCSSEYDYLQKIEKCFEYIREGQSYELCLTTKLLGVLPTSSPYLLYRLLRKLNPAPYSAFFQLDAERMVLSSSPERFLKVNSSGDVECKPIKGTRARSSNAMIDEQIKNELSVSKKDFSENLMIVDLIRNDLGRCCRLGSVEVTKLMQVETFQNVHQLVSTIRGSLKADVTPVECLKSCFPPGSMTGAPKLRSVELLSQLEGANTCPRGVYSGTLGFMSADGAIDFNVIIRTIVVYKKDGQWCFEVGAGGAIIATSEKNKEYEEMVTKLMSVLPSIALSASID